MATLQQATPPYTTRCLDCGVTWFPKPAKSGPNKGKHTDASLQREADEHGRTCPGVFPGETVSPSSSPPSSAASAAPGATPGRRRR